MSGSARCELCGEFHASGTLCSKRSARVLVVDDNVAVLRVMERILKRSGYDVVAASSGKEALQRFGQFGPFDLLITDVVMPGEIQGVGLINELRKKQNELPVIFITGYSSEIILRDAVHLVKPVQSDTLRSVVKNLLLI